MGGLLVSIVSLWFPAFEGWAGKQTNFKGRLKLHCETLGIPKMEEHRFFISTFWIQDTSYHCPQIGITRYLLWLRNALRKKNYIKFTFFLKFST